MSFVNQVTLAKKHPQLVGAVQQSDYIRKINADDIKDIIAESDFEEGMNRAYSQHALYNNYGLGYNIRWNPHTGKKEMFVAGSQGWKDWFMNATDTLAYGGEKIFGNVIDKSFEEETGLPAALRPHLSQYNRYRAERSKKLSAIAKEEHVDVIYGHSRGGAVVADLDVDARKVGLDAAMVIAQNTQMENYRRPGVFDAVLGVSGSENITVESGHGIHWAYGEGDS